MGVRLADKSDATRATSWFPGALLIALLLACTGPALALELHQGVATCAGSTCHGRQAADGAIVRQNELVTWLEQQVDFATL